MHPGLRVGRVRDEREALYRDEWWRLLVGTICGNLDREEVLRRAAEGRRDRGESG